jgi:hypothetical protein
MVSEDFSVSQSQSDEI